MAEESTGQPVASAGYRISQKIPSVQRQPCPALVITHHHTDSPWLGLSCLPLSRRLLHFAGVRRSLFELNFTPKKNQRRHHSAAPICCPTPNPLSICFSPIPWFHSALNFNCEISSRTTFLSPQQLWYCLVPVVHMLFGYVKDNRQRNFQLLLFFSSLVFGNQLNWLLRLFWNSLVDQGTSLMGGSADCWWIGRGADRNRSSKAWISSASGSTWFASKDANDSCVWRRWSAADDKACLHLASVVL